MTRRTKYPPKVKWSIYTECFHGDEIICYFLNRMEKQSFISDSSLYNYAGDNAFSYSGYDLDKIIKTLEKESFNLIDWFTSNQMKANPDPSNCYW